MKTSSIVCLIFSCLIILFANSSCKRSDGVTVVEGQVVDKFTGKGIPDALVGVYSVSSNSMGGFNYKEVEKQADSKGNFSFSFDSEDNRDYALIASKSNIYASNYANPLILKEDRNNKKLEVKMEPYAWVRVKLVNVAPKDMVSGLHLQGFEDMVNGQVSTSLFNFKSDTIFVRSISGNKETIFLYEIVDMAGNKIRSNPTIYFPASDTTDLILNY